jgi:hypothetical protein
LFIIHQLINTGGRVVIQVVYKSGMDGKGMMKRTKNLFTVQNHIAMELFGKKKVVNAHNVIYGFVQDVIKIKEAVNMILMTTVFIARIITLNHQNKIELLKKNQQTVIFIFFGILKIRGKLGVLIKL